MTELNSGTANRDLHLHTRYTDGKADIVEVLRRAEEVGLAEVAFTEHVRRETSWFASFADEVRGAARSSSLRVYVGCEARIVDEEGNLDVSDETRALCDVVLASVHRFPGPNGAPVPFSAVPKADFAAIERRLALGFLERGGADVLAHPGGMSLRYGDGFPEEYFVDLAQAARAGGVAIEINSSYLKDLATVLHAFQSVDPLISIGSDAHDLQEIGTCRDRLSEILWPA